MINSSASANAGDTCLHSFGGYLVTPLQLVSGLPSEHDTLKQCYINVGPKTLNNIVSVYRVCWVVWWFKLCACHAGAPSSSDLVFIFQKDENVSSLLNTRKRIASLATVHYPEKAQL